MTTLDEALQHNRDGLQQFKCLTKVKICIRLISRNIYTSYTPHHIILHSGNSVTAHDGNARKDIDLATANICLENEATTMSLLIQRLMQQYVAQNKASDQKFNVEFYIASEQKIDACKYSFAIRDIVSKEAANIRKSM